MKKRKEKTQLFTFGGKICHTAEKATLYWLIVLFATRTFTSTILSSIHYLTEKPLHSVDNSCAKLSKGFERLFFFTLAKTVSICLASQVLLLSQKQLKRYFLWKTDWMFFGKGKKNRCKKQSFPSSSEKSSSSNLEKKKVAQLLIHFFFFLYLRTNLKTNYVLLLKDFCLH